MRCAAARRFRPRRIDRRVSLLDVDNLPFLIDHECRSVCHTGIHQQNTIIGGHLTLGEIAEQGKLYVGFGSEFFLGRSVVGTNSKNLGL